MKELDIETARKTESLVEYMGDEEPKRYMAWVGIGWGKEESVKGVKGVNPFLFDSLYRKTIESALTGLTGLTEALKRPNSKFEIIKVMENG